MYEAACASTNTWATQYLLRQAMPEGTVFITDRQYQGKGQRGNNWYSEPYRNLTFSVVLYPTFLSAMQSFSLNIISALALRQSLSAFVANHLTNKWPNDIYYQDQKISGVLIENIVERQQLRASVIGIGLNVNQVHFHEKGPTSLAQICGRTFDLQPILSQLLTKLEHNYLQLQAQGVIPLEEAYTNGMYWIHEPHIFRDAKSQFQGKIRGINAIGQLVMEHADGALRVYNAREIAFVA